MVSPLTDLNLQLAAIARIPQAGLIPHPFPLLKAGPRTAIES
jgi:hypothetical protein